MPAIHSWEGFTHMHCGLTKIAQKAIVEVFNSSTGVLTAALHAWNKSLAGIQRRCFLRLPVNTRVFLQLLQPILVSTPASNQPALASAAEASDTRSSSGPPQVGMCVH
jgi:hypothetical protein